MKKDATIALVGHNDIIEKTLRTFFRDNGYANIFSSSEKGLDVLDSCKVQDFFETQTPEYVVLGSVRSGGIAANQAHPAEFIYENLMAQSHVIHHAYKSRVKKLIYLAGSCAYPRKSAQPIAEDSLLAGPLEPTSEAYAVAKIAGIKMCQAYRQQYGLNALTVIPSTVYGPGSDTDAATSHVLGALLSRFHTAVKNNEEQVSVWGSGKPRREFLFSDDFAAGIHFLLENSVEDEVLNIGAGEDVTIKELAEMIANVVGFKGEIAFDTSKPDGMFQKLLDTRRISNMGWAPQVGLREGIQKAYEWLKTIE